MNMLITQEIGSFRKPAYLSSRFRTLRADEFIDVAGRATLETLELFEESGLMNLGVGGEMFRWEMYEHPVSRIDGIKIHGPVRSFDNRYYNKGSVVSDISRKSSFHREEVEFLKKTKKSNFKIPITGPYTLMDWSFNEHYRTREDLAYAFAGLVNEEIRELKSIWGDEVMQVQIDEPAATTHPSEMEIVKESINESVKGISGIEKHLHVCYSKDYDLLFDIVPSLDIDVYNLEFANRDDLNPGNERKGYEDVRKFSIVSNSISRKIELGLGVTDVHIDVIESPDLIADRINYALKFLEPTRIRINPDCGLRTRSREVGFGKLKNMAEAREKVLASI
jgi:5-methyltetrahydropteroyltriglutamate--homocysteine methyltransferase